MAVSTTEQKTMGKTESTLGVIALGLIVVLVFADIYYAKKF